MNSTAHSAIELSMIGDTSNNSNSGKKRKATDDQEPQNPQKQAKKEQNPTLATGFLVNGDWVDNTKFSCVKCRRGNRVGYCEHAKQGIPVVPLNKVGRPGVKEDKSTNKKCKCPKAQQCYCRHVSYMLEEITVNNEKKWKIQEAVWSNGRCEVLGEIEPYDPVIAEMIQL